VLCCPLKEALVPHGLTLGALAFVFGVDLLAEIFGVGEVKRDVVRIEPPLERFDLTIKGANYLLKVGGNGNQIFTPIKLSFVAGAGAVGKEVSVNTKLGISGSPPSLSRAWFPLRAGL
jgi:hypothetical protein